MSGKPNVPVGHQCRDERAGEREIERVEKTEREMGRRGHREGEREGGGREKENLEVGDEQSGRFFWNLISWIGYHETGMLSKKIFSIVFVHFVDRNVHISFHVQFCLQTQHKDVLCPIIICYI